MRSKARISRRLWNILHRLASVCLPLLETLYLGCSIIYYASTVLISYLIWTSPGVHSNFTNLYCTAPVLIVLYLDCTYPLEQPSTTEDDQWQGSHQHGAGRVSGNVQNLQSTDVLQVMSQYEEEQAIEEVTGFAPS